MIDTVSFILKYSALYHNIVRTNPDIIVLICHLLEHFKISSLIYGKKFSGKMTFNSIAKRRIDYELNLSNNSYIKEKYTRTMVIIVL